mgnify:CR=1 FL=1
MKESISEYGREKIKFPFPHLKSKNSPMWNIEIDYHSFEGKDYRDRIRMYKDECNNNQMLTIICFNPGKLHSKKEEIHRDTSLRIIRDVFENSNHLIEVLNLLNLNKTEMEEVKGMYQNGEINKIKHNNPIKECLKKHKPDHLVFIQWG